MTNTSPQSTGSRREGGSGLTDLTIGNDALADDVRRLKGAVAKRITACRAYAWATGYEEIEAKLADIREANVNVGLKLFHLKKTYGLEIMLRACEEAGLQLLAAAMCAADERNEDAVCRAEERADTLERRVRELEAELFKAHQSKRGVA
ncbi:MAG: hypothetical protein HUU19_12085 [Phycisphaerales bacterium]|nr:hypothetical protein [Phycisphaerales bacterium]